MLTYEWDLDGDGQFDDSTETAPTLTYLRRGTYTVTLRVTDTSGASTPTRSRSRSAAGRPRSTIAAPRPPTPGRSATTISFSGSATDQEDGALAGSALDWALILRHCDTPGDCHEHELEDFLDAGRFARSSRPTTSTRRTSRSG